MRKIKKIMIPGIVLVALSISAIFTRSNLIFVVEVIVAFAFAFAVVESTGDRNDEIVIERETCSDVEREGDEL